MYIYLFNQKRLKIRMNDDDIYLINLILGILENVISDRCRIDSIHSYLHRVTRI